MSGDLDLESRQLCPDGACIGVIGADGRCKVCGREGEPGGAYRARVVTEAEIEAEAEAETGGETDAATGSEADPDFEQRQLCPDGNCIGVIGSDGRCKVCGLEAKF